MISTLILQSESSCEIRACLAASMLSREPVRVIRASIADLSLGRFAQGIASGEAMAVGSVEFVRAAFVAGGLQEPLGLSYPPELERYLHREVRQCRAGEVLGRWFVKPVQTKLFTGFVFDTMQDPAAMDEHDREQYEAFMAMSPMDMVWISEPVEFVSEWRYYVEGQRILGRARYDRDGEEGATEPDQDVVSAILSSLPVQHPCAVDVGVLSTGETALVEVNDAWALGLYSRAMKDSDYLEFLKRRWAMLAKR